MRFHVSSSKSELLHFDELLLCKLYKDLAKRDSVISHDTE